MNKSKKILWITTHPISYQTPLLNTINSSKYIDLNVIYFDLFSDREYYDHLFNRNIFWNSETIKNFQWIKTQSIKISKKEQTFFSPLVFGLYKEINKVKPDYVVITGWNHYALILSAIYSKILKIKLIIRSEAYIDSDESVKYRFLKRLYLSMFDVIGYIGTKNKEFYTNILKNNKKRYVYLPYSVDNNKFLCTNKSYFKKSLCKKLNFDSSLPLFIYVGKLTFRKNIKYLITCFDKLITNKRIKANLLVVGSGSLEQKCKEILINNSNIKFTGFVDQKDLKEYYSSADILVIPSLFEPWGLVLNEAMAAGCAIIASDKVISTFDLVINNYNGFIYSNEKNELENAIMTMLSNDYSDFGVKGINLLKLKSNYDIIKNNLEDLIKHESEHHCTDL
jgi:glycosyltransferase involved in cell wall biosynthesis